MSNTTNPGYDTLHGLKKAHTPKIPKDLANYKKLKGADATANYNVPGPIIHDDRNPDTEEPFTPLFNWILKEARNRLSKIESAASDKDLAKAVGDFEQFVEFLHERDPKASIPNDPATNAPYDWARIGPTISEAAIEPIFTKGAISGMIVTVTWLGGTHTSSSSQAVP